MLQSVLEIGTVAFPVAYRAVRSFETSGVLQAEHMSADQRIREKLMVAFEPVRLDVINESELHAGHRGSPGTGESHYRVLVVSSAFAGKSRVARHRMVNEVLADELSGCVHALALATYTPDEAIG